MTKEKISLPEVFHYETTLDVRVGDLNFANHMGHVELINMLHEARVSFLRKYGLAEMMSEELALLIAKLSVDYKNQAFYGDKLLFQLALSKLGGTTCELVYCVKQANSLIDVAYACTVSAFYNPKLNKLVSVPPKIREKLVSLLTA